MLSSRNGLMGALVLAVCSSMLGVDAFTPQPWADTSRRHHPIGKSMRERQLARSERRRAKSARRKALRAVTSR